MKARLRSPAAPPRRVAARTRDAGRSARSRPPLARRSCPENARHLRRPSLADGTAHAGPPAAPGLRAPHETGLGALWAARPARPLVPDDLWAAIEPLPPPARPKPKGGRPPVPDRAALTGIIFVLKTGIQWEDPPAEMGCGSGMACWRRRLRDWRAAGMWACLHRLLLERPAAGAAARRRQAGSAQGLAGQRLRPGEKGERRPARTRRTAARRTPSGMSSSSTATAPR